MGSDNPTGADNQQETAQSRRLLELDAQWLVGFVDGEGCFSVSVHKNGFCRSTGGWQLHPVFQVSQHLAHRAVLEAVQQFFGVGNVRSKGPRSPVHVYAVDGLAALDTVIVPFFERHPLLVKGADFAAFAEIVRCMRRREHLERSGFERLVTLAYGMNANGKQRARAISEVLAGSSETAREAAPSEELKIQSDLHGDMQSQAEMSWPAT